MKNTPFEIMCYCVGVMALCYIGWIIFLLLLEFVIDYVKSYSHFKKFRRNWKKPVK